MDELITYRQACKLLGVSTTTLTKYMKQGKITYYKRGERNSRVFFTKKDLANFINKIKKN